MISSGQKDSNVNVVRLKSLISWVKHRSKIENYKTSKLHMDLLVLNPFIFISILYTCRGSTTLIPVISNGILCITL